MPPYLTVLFVAFSFAAICDLPAADPAVSILPGVPPKSIAAMGIAGGLGKLFSTHPPMEERIAALQALGK